MPRVTPIPWKDFEKFLFSVGCTFKRRKGDHRVYQREGLKRPIIVPQQKEIPIFIIRNNLRVLGITTEKYLKILEEL